MKLIIKRTALLKSLTHVQSIVERRNTIPILSNILLRAENDRLSLVTTDLDIEVEESAFAEVFELGAITTPGHSFYEIVRKLPEKANIQIYFEPQTARLIMSSGRSQFNLAVLPADDFPILSGGNFQVNFSISAGALQSLIDRAKFAISTEETRYYLNGIYLHVINAEGKKNIRAVATDGHRLARIDALLPDGAENMPNVIIPRKTVIALRKLIEDTGKAVDIGISDTKIRFKFGDSVLISKLIDGQFPNYEQVIPSSYEKTIDIKCKAFTDAVDRVSAIAVGKSRAVKIVLSSTTLTLSASSPELGTASEEMEINYNADAIEMGFNSRYLLDIAKQVKGETLNLLISDSNAPALLRDIEDPSALYVLMPMRI